MTADELRTFAEELGFRLPPLNTPVGYSSFGLKHQIGICDQFWQAVTGYEDPPWYSGSSGVFQLPVTDKPPGSYFRLLTMHLAGRTAPVFVVFAQAVLAEEGRCPELLTAEAARLLATEVQVVSDEELGRRILRRNFIVQPSDNAG